MKIKVATITSQVYLLPYIKITHSRWLNGELELIIGWFNKEIVISI